MKLLAGICARVVYAIFGGAVLGLYLALILGFAFGCFGLVFGAHIFEGAAIVGLNIGLILGVLIGGFGKTAILTVGKEIWSGLPHAVYSLGAVGGLFAVPMLLFGWFLGLMFDPVASHALGQGLAVVCGSMGAMLGFATGYSQRDQALDAIWDALKMLYPVILVGAGCFMFMLLCFKLAMVLTGAMF